MISIDFRKFSVYTGIPSGIEENLIHTMVGNAPLLPTLPSEDTTNHGRIDMTVQLDGNVYIFEFKVVDIDQTPGTALEQIKQKGYADKYRADTSEIYLIGVEFDRDERNIVRFEWERD